MRILKLAAAWLLLWAPTAAFGLEFARLTLEQALRELTGRGLSILYSSALVKPEMRVLREPAAGAPRAMLEEIVRPHGIAVADGPNGALVLVRAQVSATHLSRGAAPVVAALTEVVVSASRYQLVRIAPPSLTALSSAELRLAPNLGDDPLRTLARLPGTAGSDVSAKLNVRGGATNETLVRFDGLRLANPFHLKDFQSVFSAIDPAVVGSIDVYTGGFPAMYGDRLSGVIDIRPLEADIAGYREIALSLFNASALGSGRFNEERSDWVVAARRGNLDLVLDLSGMNLGEPAYSDIYAHLGHRISDALRLSGNMLLFDDDIELADPDREEQARAVYKDRYAWLKFNLKPSAQLQGDAIIARSEFDSSRRGRAEQPGIIAGELIDRRALTIDSLQTEWTWSITRAAALAFGGEVRRSAGRYEYEERRDLDFLFATPGAATQRRRERRLRVHRSGRQYGAYAALRGELTHALIGDAGLRWDRSTLSTPEQRLSPRTNLLYRLNDDVSLRASWGRFFQMQGINELQIADGVAEFHGAQRADHLLIGVDHRLPIDVHLRVEGYRKRYTSLAPRFENLLNTLVILPELKPDRIRIAPRSALATGVEASLRSLHTRPFYWWLSYAWSRIEDEFPDRTVRRSWDQRHAVSVGAGWQTARWELSFAGAFHSGWPTTTLVLEEEAGEPVVRTGVINAQRIGAYVDLDARLARVFNLRGDATLTAFFELSNLLNRRNECCIEYDVERESDEGPFPLNVERIRSLPLLPSLGVILKF